MVFLNFSCILILLEANWKSWAKGVYGYEKIARTQWKKMNYKPLHFLLIELKALKELL